MVARTEEATEGLFSPGVNAHPMAVGDEIARILVLSPEAKPFRSVVDLTDSGVDEANAIVQKTLEAFVRRMGFGELLRPKLGPQRRAEGINS